MNTKQIRELDEKRCQLITEARGIHELAGKEEREPTADEIGRFDKLMNEANDLGDQINELRSADRREADLKRHAEMTDDLNSNSQRRTQSGQPGENSSTAGGEDRAAEIERRYQHMTRTDRRAMTAISRPEYRSMFARYLVGGFNAIQDDQEARSLQADLDVDGGFLLAPLEMAEGILKFVDDNVYIRQRATTFQTVSAQGTGITSLDSDPDDADWTTEIEEVNEDDGMKFGRRELYPRELTKLIKISRKLLRLTPNIEGFVQGRLGYKFGITQEKAFMTGTGDGQPLGLFVASDQGISTGRDVSSGNTATEIQYEGVVAAKWSLKEGYLNNAEWLYSRAAMEQITLLKDGDGRYIWQLTAIPGEPDTLLGRPVRVSEYVPNTFSANAYVGIIGDLSYYYIADSLMMEVQVLLEKYANTNQVGYIGRMSTDGMPALEEAFSRVQLGS